jgi:hypothetical protein
MKIIRTVAALIAAVMLAACGEVSTQYPVGSTTGLALDPALIGTWLPRAEKSKDIERTTDGKVAGYIHVLPSKDGTFDIVMVSLPSKPGDKGDYQIYRATAGRTGENRFLNIVMLSPPGEQPSTAPKHGTIPVLYRFEANGDLAIFKLDNDKTVAAIRAGAIAGVIEKNTYTYDGKAYEGTPDVRITAAPLALDAFMATPEATALFAPMGLLKKAE